MNLEIDKEKCIGCGLCQNICPSSFEIKNGLAEIKENNDKNCDADEIINSCPCMAIKVKGEN